MANFYVFSDLRSTGHKSFWPKAMDGDFFVVNLHPSGHANCSDIVFLLDFHRDIDRLPIEIKVTSLFDIFFQHHNDVVAIK